jgi:hypothetical protein
VYLTIGNISKDIRRKATQHATLILGYLPVDTFKDVPGKTKQRNLKVYLVHQAMRAIMEPLGKAGECRVEMLCADGRTRRVYSRLAAFVGDWPEQNDMACRPQGGCPICLKGNNERGDKRRALMRNCASTLWAIYTYLQTVRVRAMN